MSTKKETVLKILGGVCDPEIPVLNVVEMGIVQNVDVHGESVLVEITPTYSGCPAMRMIQDDIVAALTKSGYSDVRINTVHSPAWTTAGMSEESKQKLREYGIAPPRGSTGNVVVLLPGKEEELACPFCGSLRTELRSEFGSTACKSFYFCTGCRQPFEHFKDI